MISNETKEICDELIKLKEEKKDQEKKFNEKINELKIDINTINGKLNQQNKDNEQIKKQINELMPEPIHCEYKGESDLSGILDQLKNSVTLSAGGEKNSNYPIKNIIINDDNNFFNAIKFDKKNKESDAWILFDFGSSRKIDLFSYLIRSSYNEPSSSYQPKTWRIMGSNDNQNWKQLDKRLNDENLNGWGLKYHCRCQSNEHGKSSNRYRYIKYVQEDNWCDGKTGHDKNPYNIFLKFLELYGDIYE